LRFMEHLRYIRALDFFCGIAVPTFAVEIF
jgi:hypothetical protein